MGQVHLQSELVVSALNMALYQRRPQDVIHHSDQGAQYTSIAFGKRCREAGVRPSMGSAGDCYDNAMCESFFATLECELSDRRCFRTHKEARLVIFSYIEGWYNPHRRHSSIAYHAPIAYEKLHLSQAWNTSPKYFTEAMLLPNSKSVHTEPEFRPQTAIFSTANSLSTNSATASKAG